MFKFLPLFLVLLFPVHSYAVSGYMMGELVRYSESNKTIFSSGDGEISFGIAGRPSSCRFKVSGKVVTATFNPRKFSTSDFDPELSKLQGLPVVMEYTKPTVHFGIQTSSPYEVTKVYGLKDFSPENRKAYVFTHKQTSDTICRIVQASTVGYLEKEFQITIQIKNVYRFFSIEEKSLYDFAVKCLKSGKLVRISHEERELLKSIDVGVPLSRRTVAIEILQ